MDIKKEIHTKKYDEAKSETSPNILYSIRCAIVFFIYLCAKHQDTINSWIAVSWRYLCSTWVFNSVYFETWYVTVVYTLILHGPIIMDSMRSLDKFKMDPKSSFFRPGKKAILREGIVYLTPLMLLDTFMVKKYDGVASPELGVRAKNIIQTTRALPYQPPTTAEIAIQLLLSFVIYDAIFFAIHLLLHRNAWLYKHLHSPHHEHTHLQARVTNQLSVTERIVLVLSANNALRLVQGHPITRIIFVPFFLWGLIENHSGYDLPYSVDKIVPFGLIGGAKSHYEHHMQGARNYQPFFTYLDYWLSRKSRKCNKS